jgi:hypothetical protein
MKIRWMLLILVLFLSPGLYAGIGKISYINGPVEISRNGEILDEYDLDIGFEIENFDRVRTGVDGEVIIDIDTPKSPQSEIRIASNTTFSIMLESIEQKKRTTFALITGSIGLKIKKLSGDQELEVRSETVALGVRGTEFSVQSSPAGDVLISCDSGSVACYDEDEGREFIAEPGQVVEKKAQELFRRIPVAVSNLESFKEQWIAERISVFKANALKAIIYYSKRYNAYYDAFVKEYKALIAKSIILNRWYQEDRDGKIGSRIQIMKDLKEINKHIFELRKILFIFERIYFRLLELNAYFNEGYGRGRIQPGLSAAAFFRRFDRERKELAGMIVKVRYIMKLQAERSARTFSLDF